MKSLGAPSESSSSCADCMGGASRSDVWHCEPAGTSAAPKGVVPNRSAAEDGGTWVGVVPKGVEPNGSERVVGAVDDDAPKGVEPNGSAAGGGGTGVDDTPNGVEPNGSAAGGGGAGGDALNGVEPNGSAAGGGGAGAAVAPKGVEPKGSGADDAKGSLGDGLNRLSACGLDGAPPSKSPNRSAETVLATSGLPIAMAGPPWAPAAGLILMLNFDAERSGGGPSSSSSHFTWLFQASSAAGGAAGVNSDGTSRDGIASACCGSSRRKRRNFSARSRTASRNTFVHDAALKQHMRTHTAESGFRTLHANVNVLLIH